MVQKLDLNDKPEPCHSYILCDDYKLAVMSMPSLSCCACLRCKSCGISTIYQQVFTKPQVKYALMSLPTWDCVWSLEICIKVLCWGRFRGHPWYVPPLFLQRRGAWLCGHSGAVTFLLKKCLHPHPPLKIPGAAPAVGTCIVFLSFDFLLKIKWTKRVHKRFIGHKTHILGLIWTKKENYSICWKL